MAKILFISDAAFPLGTSAFGIVSGQWLGTMEEPRLAAKHDVVHIAGNYTNDKPPYQGQLPYRVYRPGRMNPNGFDLIDPILENERPELLCLMMDVGTAYEWLRYERLKELYTVAYLAIEGAPLMPSWCTIMKQIQKVIVFTEFTAKAVKEQTGLDFPVIPHGIDHAPFQPYEKDARDVIRKQFRVKPDSQESWGDKFVVGYVKRNISRGQHPRLIEAMKILKDQGYDDIVLYLHCLPFERFFLDGWNLHQIVMQHEVTEKVFFNFKYKDPWRGIPYDVSTTDLPSLIDIYNAMDLFVFPSQAEAFGLPPLEAAACGVPVAASAYGPSWEVVKDFAFPLEVHDWSTHCTGVRLANIHPEHIAEVIKRFYHDTELRNTVREGGLKAVKKYKWGPAIEALNGIVDEALGERDILRQAEEIKKRSP